MTSEESAAVRPPFVYWVCLWGIGLAVALVGVAHDVLRPQLLVPPGRDFSNLYAAGKLALAGEAWQAFDIDLFRLAIREHVGALTPQNYSYPPHALFIALPFALLSYWPAFILFSLAGVASFAWAARPYVPFAPLLGVLTPAAALSLWNGHYGLLIGALWLLFFRYLDERPMRAGLAAAMLTFKPHMGLFVALAALSRPRAFLAAAVATAALVAASVTAFGIEGWHSFIGQTIGAQAKILTRDGSDFYFRLMPSAYIAYGQGGIGWVTQALFAGAALALLVRARRIDAFAFATATFLVLPYVLGYDMTVACLGFAILLWRDWGSLRGWERAALTAAFFAPDLSLFVQPLVPPILLAGLYLQTRAEKIA